MQMHRRSISIAVGMCQIKTEFNVSFLNESNSNPTEQNNIISAAFLSATNPSIYFCNNTVLHLRDILYLRYCEVKWRNAKDLPLLPNHSSPTTGVDNIIAHRLIDKSISVAALGQSLRLTNEIK